MHTFLITSLTGIAGVAIGPFIAGAMMSPPPNACGMWGLIPLSAGIFCGGFGGILLGLLLAFFDRK